MDSFHRRENECTRGRMCKLIGSFTTKALITRRSSVQLPSAKSRLTHSSAFRANFPSTTRRLGPLRSIMAPFSDLSNPFAVSLSLSEGSKGTGRFLNPNRQIDFGRLLNPFVFRSALMKEQRGRGRGRPTQKRRAIINEPLLAYQSFTLRWVR